LRSEAGAVDAAHHCLAHPDDENARVRVVHRVRRVGGDANETTPRWRTSSIDVWFERRDKNDKGPRCVAPFSGAARLPTSELAATKNARRWRYVPEASAVYFLMWDDDEYATDQADADAKSFFTMLADAGEAEDLVFLSGGDGDGDGDAAARRAFEAAKRSRYAGYRDAVATVRDKYKSAPDRIGGGVGVGVASDDAGTSTWFDFFPFVDPFQKSGRTFGASAAPASGTAVAGSE
jgi:hypothetical protein